MPQIAANPISPLSPVAGSQPADEAFWLAMVDGDVPKASITRDRKRVPGAARHYGLTEFAIGPETTQALRNRGAGSSVSDIELCAGLLAALMATYQREDRLLVGLRTDAFSSDPGLVVPLQLRSGTHDSFADIVDDVASQLAQIRGRSTAVLARLPQVLGVGVDGQRHPLYDIVLAVGAPGIAVDLAAFPVDLAFLFEATGSHLRGRVQWADDLYESATMDRVVGHIRRLAERIAGKLGAAMHEIDIMADDERRAVLFGFNDARAAFPVHATFHSLFEAQALRTPRAIAVVHRDQELTYEDVNARANQIARALLNQGLERGAFVGILLHRGCDFLCAMLGVFKAGGAYVPLDPTYPRDRVAYMLADSEAALLITDAPLVARFGETVTTSPRLSAVLSVRGELPERLGPDGAGPLGLSPSGWSRAPTENPPSTLSGRDRAYMIYTSGSTGRPKGAICRHDGALNHLFGELEGIGVRSAFNFLQTAASSSDISVWQFMAPVLMGGATIVADYETVVDPPALFELMRARGVNVAEPVPVVLRALLDHIGGLPEAERAIPGLVCMMCTGEALPGELVDRWLALYPHIPIANTYGPTETSDDVTLLVQREPLGHRFAVTPIGRPLPNVAVFLLDRELRPVPVGVPGELCVGGIAVGEGYWRQPDKTQAAFVPCPFPEVADGPMYRTGDLGRWLPDGTIEFLGRIDHQIKVRGFRVEPGEIEDMLNKHPAVQDAAVVAVADAQGNRRLVGHYVERDGLSVTAFELRQFLKSKLADHMVPSVLVPLKALPLTPLGKIDRRALMRIEAPAPADAGSRVAPRSELEQLLVQLWSEVTGVPQVSVHDNFFEIGGDSLQTIEVVTVLRERGFEIAPSHLFQHPSPAELASHLRPRRHGEAPRDDMAQCSRVEATWEVARWREALLPLFPDLLDVFPLSATQRGIYFQSLLMPKSSGAYVEQVIFELRGELDQTLFQRAWQHAVDAIDALRTAVVRRGAPFPLQVVVGGATIVPSYVDLRELPAERQEQRLSALVAEDRMKGFDLKRPPLCRVSIARLGTSTWRVLWTYHHLVLDGWAEPRVLGAVFAAYDALLGGKAPAIERGRPYRDFVLWSETHDARGAEAYWRAQLAGFTSPVTITDTSPAVAPPSTGELAHGWAGASLTDAQRQALDRVARRNGLTISTLLHGAWALLLHRETGAGDVVFGSVASGRQGDLSGIDSIIGLVAVTQPLRTRVTPEATVVSWLRLVQLQMAEMREHERAPLASIQQWSDVPLGKYPLFDTIVVVGNYAGNDLSGCRPQGLALDGVRYITQPLFAFTLFAVTEPALSISLVYDKRKCAPETAKQLLRRFAGLLEAISENPEQRVASLVATGSA